MRARVLVCTVHCTLRPTPAVCDSVSLKRAADTFSLLSVSVSVSSNTPHPTPHAVYDTWGPPAGARARERAAERREKAWKWGVWVHAVRFTEPDTESAGARNSASDRAKWGCGVGYGVLLELVSGLVRYDGLRFQPERFQGKDSVNPVGSLKPVLFASLPRSDPEYSWPEFVPGHKRYKKL
jgi:hypothetical protein